MHNKKKFSKINKATIVGLTSILSMSLAASSCGTFAWFIYTTRASAYYDGVTIGSGKLQVGLVSKEKLQHPEVYSLEEEADGEQFIYWAPRVLSSELIKYYLGMNSYATNTLIPVSSRSYTNGDNFSLSRAPMFADSTPHEADTFDYINLSLAFRFAEDELDPSAGYVPNLDIYLPEVEIRTEHNISNAIRIFTHSNVDHLICPTDFYDGSTFVGGLLDLNDDGYYDFVNAEDGGHREYFYGDHEHGIAYSEAPEENDSELIGAPSTFNAKHKSGVYSIDVSASYPMRAEYEGFSKFEDMEVSVANTGMDPRNYAFLDLYLYVEGWDLSVINEEIGSEFAAGLRFEVDV